MQRIATSLGLALVSLLASVSASAAEKPQLAALACSVVAAQGAPATGHTPSGLPLFSWPDETALSATVSFQLDGYTGVRKVAVYAVLFAEPLGGAATAKRDERALAKFKGTHDLAAGPQSIAFPEIWHTDEYAGRHRYRLDVEASVKGGKAVQQSYHFETQGPPPPQIEIISAEAWNPNGSRDNSVFQPGDPLALNVLFEIKGSAARHGPRLSIAAIMNEDKFTVEDLAATAYGEQFADRRDLAPEDGEYQLITHAQLPLFFSDAWNTQHAFRITVELDSGDGQPVRQTDTYTIVDYHAGGDRQSADLTPRLIQLDRALKWDIRLQRPGVDTRRS